MLTHTAPKQTGHGLKDTLTVFRSLQKSECCRAVLLLIPSFAWSLKAAAAAGRMKDIGHSQPWLIDALADVCCGWLPETDLPPLLRQWKRTDTMRKPRTFSGIDFEMQNLRADAGGKGIPILALRSDADFNAVMRVPACAQVRLASFRTGNWRLH